MRVLLVGNTGGNPDEGMKQVLMNLGHQISVVHHHEVKVINPSTLVRELSRVAKWNPHIVHYLGGPTYFSILLLTILRARISLEPKMVISFIHPKLGLFSGILLRAIRVDQVLAPSQNWYNWCCKRKLPVSLHPVSGVDIQRFVPVSQATKLNLRRRLNLSENELIVLHVGHIKEDRNLRVLGSLQRKSKGSIQVVIIGSTTTHHDRDLLGQLTGLGCKVLIEFVPDIQSYYQMADVYVFPTVDSQAAIQIPLSVLEAMSCNLPVVTTRFGGLEDLFLEENGLYYLDQLDGKALWAAVVAASECKSVATREMIMELNWAHIGQKTVDLYSLLLGPK